MADGQKTLLVWSSAPLGEDDLDSLRAVQARHTTEVHRRDVQVVGVGSAIVEVSDLRLSGCSRGATRGSPWHWLDGETCG